MKTTMAMAVKRMDVNEEYMIIALQSAIVSHCKVRW